MENEIGIRNQMMAEEASKSCKYREILEKFIVDANENEPEKIELESLNGDFILNIYRTLPNQFSGDLRGIDGELIQEFENMTPVLGASTIKAKIGPHKEGNGRNRIIEEIPDIIEENDNSEENDHSTEIEIEDGKIKIRLMKSGDDMSFIEELSGKLQKSKKEEGSNQESSEINEEEKPESNDIREIETDEEEEELEYIKSSEYEGGKQYWYKDKDGKIVEKDNAPEDHEDYNPEGDESDYELLIAALYEEIQELKQKVEEMSGKEPKEESIKKSLMEKYPNVSEESINESIKKAKKHSAPSKKPPKEWWNKMEKEIKKENPEYSQEQVDKTIGDIWYNEMSKKDKKEKREEHGKTYGKLKKAIEDIEGFEKSLWHEETPQETSQLQETKSLVASYIQRILCEFKELRELRFEVDYMIEEDSKFKKLKPILEKRYEWLKEELMKLTKEYKKAKIEKSELESIIGEYKDYIEKADVSKDHLKDMIEEHKRLVQVLGSGSKEDIKKELEIQSKELNKYKKKYENMDKGEEYPASPAVHSVIGNSDMKPDGDKKDVEKAKEYPEAKEEADSPKEINKLDKYIKMVETDKMEIQDVIKKVPEGLRDDFLERMRKKYGKEEKACDVKKSLQERYPHLSEDRIDEIIKKAVNMFNKPKRSRLQRMWRVFRIDMPEKIESDKDIEKANSGIKKLQKCIMNQGKSEEEVNKIVNRTVIEKYDLLNKGKKFFKNYEEWSGGHNLNDKDPSETIEEFHKSIKEAADKRFSVKQYSEREEKLSKSVNTGINDAIIKSINPEDVKWEEYKEFKDVEKSEPTKEEIKKAKEIKKRWDIPEYKGNEEKLVVEKSSDIHERIKKSMEPKEANFSGKYKEIDEEKIRMQKGQKTDLELHEERMNKEIWKDK